jgi:hypothetical protein
MPHKSMKTRKPRTTKSLNGQGESVTVYFDQDDPQERRAQIAAQLLAAKHGRRKQVIVTLLDVIYQHYAQTGELPSANAVASALERGFAIPTVPFVMLSANAEPVMTPSRAEKKPSSQQTGPVSTKPPLHLQAGVESKSNSADVATRFASSLASYLG